MMNIKINLNDIVKKIMEFLNKIRSKIFGTPLIEEFNLGEIVAAFQDYIGLIIIDFESNNEEIPNIKEKVYGKMVTSIYTDNKEIYLALTDVSGNPAGIVTIAPTLHGEFIEMVEGGPVAMWMTQYKITFIGGAVIEYIDPTNSGTIFYSE
jgi:hypothetical protein